MRATNLVTVGDDMAYNGHESRLEQARDVAQRVLDELEMGSVPISQSLMKAKRLARLLYDQDAQIWLDWETGGYPESWMAALDQIPTCRKYVERSGRLSNNGQNMWINSLPEVEAAVEAARAQLANWGAPTTVAPSASGGGGPNIDFTGMHVRNATNEAMNKIVAKANAAQSDFIATSKRLHGFRAAIHSYALEAHLALSLGDIAEDVFSAARAEVDAFVRASAPKAAEQLLAIHARLQEGDSEALAQALTSCRRVLLTVADAVFPGRNEPYVDQSGKERDVGEDAYKNRLMAFLDQHSDSSSSSAAIKVAELEHLASRLDAVYDKVCKGVHADVSPGEARLATIHTYLVIAEVARAAAAREGSAPLSLSPSETTAERPEAT